MPGDGDDVMPSIADPRIGLGTKKYLPALLNKTEGRVGLDNISSFRIFTSCNCS